jgi:hypothetical protein
MITVPITLHFKRLEKKEIQDTLDTFPLNPNQGSDRGFLSSLSRNGESTTNTSKRTVEVGSTLTSRIFTGYLVTWAEA